MSALTDLFSSMANKIRSKTGTATTYTPPQMVSDGIDDVFDAGVASATTSITPSNDSPVALTADTGYKPTRSGYAIQSYSTVRPSDTTPPALSEGFIYKVGTMTSGSEGYFIKSYGVATPSNSSPANLASGFYKIGGTGKAVETITDVTPSSSPTSVSADDIVHIGGSGVIVDSVPTPTNLTPSNSSPATITSGGLYSATAGGVAIESYSSITPSDSSPVTLSSGSICKMNGSGKAVASVTSKTPSNTNPPSIAAGQIIKPSASGYLYSTKPTLKKTTLWTNPSPTADFSSQTVTLSSARSNFDYIGVEYKNSKSGSRYMTAYMSRSDLETSDNQLGLSAYTSAFYNRSVYVSSSNTGSEITIGHCYKLNATGTQNGYCTPYKIYGCNIQ